MKTFEEKFTAWVDGELKGKELAEFEAELPHAVDARLEKLASHQIGELFREHGRAPELTNGDFFNHQLMQRIAAESPGPAARPARRKFAWSLPGLAMAGAFSLVVAFGLFHAMIPKAEEQPAPQGIVEVIKSTGGDPGTNVKIYYSPQNDVNVVWIEDSGLKSAAAHASPEKRKDK